MILRKEIIISELDGEYVAVAAEEAGEHFHGMIRLNKTGAFITEKLKEETTKEKIADAICDTFDVSYEKAMEDTEKIINAYKSADLIVE